ncbi:hypothetical protein J2X76_001862 [Neorhizobium sp. 2083]|nr:hypothetical protein [Neorhizobium sp. 2083]
MVNTVNRPLTLALSPLAGRGDVPRSPSAIEAMPMRLASFSPSLRGEGGGSRMRGSLRIGGLC